MLVSQLWLGFKDAAQEINDLNSDVRRQSAEFLPSLQSINGTLI